MVLLCFVSMINQSVLLCGEARFVEVFVSLYYAPFLISLSSFPVVSVEGPLCAEDCVGL